MTSFAISAPDGAGARLDWPHVQLGALAVNVTDSVADPAAIGIEHSVGLEHLDPHSLRVARWGEIDADSSFIRVFAPGDVLYGKRRVYQRKAAIAEFNGVCSGDILVLRARSDKLLPELLAYLVQSEPFLRHAMATSAGSMSPRTKWKDLARFEIPLPSLPEQRNLATLLSALEDTVRSWETVIQQADLAEQCLLDELYTSARASTPRRELHEVIQADRPLCYGVVQPGPDDPTGIPLIRVCDLEDDTQESDLKRVSAAVHDEYRRSVVEKDDVLVSVVGTIGRVRIVPSQFDGFNIARAVARVAPDRAQITSLWLSAMLKSRTAQRTLIGEARETARKTLNLKELAQVELPAPPLDEQGALLGPLLKLRELQSGTTERIRRTTEMRDALVLERWLER